MIKKILLSAFVIFTFVVYTFQQRNESNAAVIVPKTTATTQTAQSQPTTSGQSPPQQSTSNAKPVSSQYKDGTYTGDVADAYYGNVEIKVTIHGGKIDDVQFLQYPNDRRNSQVINEQAMPLLKQEAIKAQSSHIDGVSGATATSGGFEQSLASALSKASNI